MKWIPIILSVLAALAMVLVGSIALAVHKVHSYSTYYGWQKYGMIDERAIEEYNAKLPPEQRRDILDQLRQAGNVRFYLRLLSRLAAFLFLLHAVVYYYVLRSCERRKKASEPADGTDGQ